MTRFIYNKCILFVVLMVKIICCQDCNQFYQYFKGNTYGSITVPAPKNHNNYIKLDVQLQFVNEEAWNGKLKFLGTTQDVLQNLPLVFKLTFNVLPKIVSISINNNNLCVSERFTAGFSQITTVKLASTVQVRTSGNHNNNPNLNGIKKAANVNFERNPLSHNPFLRNSIKNVNIESNQFSHNPFLRNSIQNVNLERNQFSHNPFFRNPESSQSLLNTTCGKTAKMYGLHLIANGRDAQVSDHPWIGAMFISKKNGKNKIIKFLCGASLITKKHAITAGHCVAPHINSDIFVIFGRTIVDDWSNKNSQLVKVAKSEIHQDYKAFSADADIAILHFNKEITFTANVQPVCLWDTSSLSEDIVDQKAVVVGWGKDEKYEFPQHLQKLYLRVASEEECLRSADEFFNITSGRTICAGNLDGSGPCQGDSGSGFYFYKGDRWFIRGIVSQSLVDSTERCDFSKYAVFLDVAKHLQWIHKLIL